MAEVSFVFSYTYIESTVFVADFRLYYFVFFFFPFSIFISRKKNNEKKKYLFNITSMYDVSLCLKKP